MAPTALLLMTILRSIVQITVVLIFIITLSLCSAFICNRLRGPVKVSYGEEGRLGKHLQTKQGTAQLETTEAFHSVVLLCDSILYCR